jgi:hypothetical protein
MLIGALHIAKPKGVIRTRITKKFKNKTMMNKLLAKSIYLSISLIIYSCNNGARKNNEQKRSSDKIELSNENKDIVQNDSLSLKIKNYLKTKFLNESDLRSITKKQRRFQFSTIDLNGDGVDEIFVYLNSTYFCGSGGCTFLLMDNNLNLITKFTVTGIPILVSEQIENNWKKLYLFSNGYREMIYNTETKSYPTNPSVADKVTEDVNNQESIVKLFSSEKPLNIYY